MRTFSVKNFDRFQHYKDRSPPWIKLYNELLENYEFGRLPDAQKGQLISIWLLASRMENKLPFDPVWVASKINATSPVDLSALVIAGFLIDGDTDMSKNAEQCATPAQRVAKSNGFGSRHIPDEVKRIVWQRDGGRCCECGSDENIEYDHKHPVSKGGSSEEGNIQLLCRTCNRRKRTRVATPAQPYAEPREEGQVQDIEQKIGGGVETRAREPSKSLITEEAFQITGEILKTMGKTQDDPLAVGGPYTVQHWLSEGMSRDAIMCGVVTAMASKKHDPPSTFKYFEKAILRASAELNRPLPKVEIRQAQTLVVTHGTSSSGRSGGSLTAELRRELAELEGPESSDPQVPDSPVFLISN